MSEFQSVPESTTLYVADEDAASRSAIEQIAASMRMKVVSFDTVEAFRANVNIDSPSILITEMRPGLSGLSLQRELRQQRKYLPIIFITTNPTARMGIDAVRGGAVDVLEKPIDEERLWPVLQKAAQEYHQQRQLFEVLEDTKQGMGQLSAQQKNVLRLWMLGKKNKAIANELGVSERTVESCRQRIRQRVQSHSRELLAAKLAIVGEFPFEEWMKKEARVTPETTPIPAESPRTTIIVPELQMQSGAINMAFH